MADIVNLESHYIGSPAPGVEIYQLPNASMQVLEDIINATWNMGIDKSNEVSTKVANATTGYLDLIGAPTVTAGSVTVPTIDEPLVTIPTDASVTDVFDTFTTEYIELATWLDNKRTAFMATYFPDEQNAYNAVEDYLQAAIANPEIGMPTAVAEQIWSDDRDRIAYDASRAAADVLDTFAAMRFPLPPGAAASAVIQIQNKAQDEIAESGRKVALVSVEQMKGVVDNLLKLRQVAMSDATDYLKALASAPDMISRMTNIGYDAQSKLISSVSSYYNARTQAKEVMSRVSQYNNTILLDADKANQSSEMGMIENKLKALLAEIAAIAQQTTAMFNNLHVSASLSANGGTTVSNSNEF